MSPPLPDSTCVLCGRPLNRRKVHEDSAAYDYDCLRCGKYRMGVAEEERFRPFAATIAPPLRNAIRRVNAAGFRLSIPSQLRVPLDTDDWSRP